MSIATRRRPSFYTSFRLNSNTSKKRWNYLRQSIDVNRLTCYYLTMFIHLARQLGE